MARETLQELVSRHAATPANLEARYQGALLGLAVGNMLGVPVEFRTKSELLRRYPAGLREIDPSMRAEPWDDDLAQAIVLAEATGEGDDYDLDDLAAALVRWRRENGLGIGGLTRRVLTAIESGTPPSDAAREVWERTGARDAGNGAVMRCPPVAMRWRRDGEALVRNALISSVVTHYDPRCRWSTAVTATVIAIALSGRTVDLEELAETAASSGAPEECVAAMLAAIPTDIHEMLLDGDDQGFTLHAMRVGLRCMASPASFEETLVRVVMQGGDTDTNGAVAGAVMGARLGVDAIPSRWLAYVPNRDYINSLAERLLVLANA